MTQDFNFYWTLDKIHFAPYAGGFEGTSWDFCRFVKSPITPYSYSCKKSINDTRKSVVNYEEKDAMTITDSKTMSQNSELNV